MYVHAPKRVCVCVCVCVCVGNPKDKGQGIVFKEWLVLE